MGVTLFFMLSGFILSYNYLPIHCKPRKFWIARLARVFPVYLFALLYSTPLALYSCHKDGVSFVPAAFAAPFLIQAWIPKAALLWNPPGWSLSVEAFFYLLFPFIAAPIARLYRRHFWVTFAGVWILSAMPSVLYAVIRPDGPIGLTSEATLLSVVRYNPLFRLPEFMLGIGVGVLYLDGRRLPRPRMVALASAIILGGMLLGLARLPYPALHNGLLAPLFAVLILSVASDAQMLGNGLLTLLGESSYSLYLLHVPTIKACTLLATWCGWSAHEFVNFAYIFISILASMICYKYIEAPGRVFIRSRLTAKEGRSLEDRHPCPQLPDSLSSE